jgi:RNA polymerase sigma factor (sigma-70 family)
MRTLGADVAIIVTQTLPKDMDRFGEKDGVYICTFTEVRSVALLLRNALLKIAEAKKSQENNGNFSIDEVCKELNIDHETYNILVSGNSATSLDSKISNDNETTLLDVIEDKNAGIEKFISDDSRKIQLKLAFSCLGHMEKEVLLYSFGLNKENREMTYSEVGYRLELSGERVRQIKIKALKKLKHYLERHFKSEIEI